MVYWLWFIGYGLLVMVYWLLVIEGFQVQEFKGSKSKSTVKVKKLTANS